MISRAKAEALWRQLSLAVDCALEAGTDDQRTLRHAQSLLEQIHFAIQSHRGEPIELFMRESLFVHQGIPMADASIAGRASIAFLRFSEAGGLAFDSQISMPSLVDLIDLARGACTGEDRAFGPSRVARVAAFRGIRLLAPSDNVTWDWIDEGPAGAYYEAAGFSLESAAPARRDIAVAVEEAMELASAGSAVEMNTARTASETMVQLGQSGYDNLMQLAERPEFDVFTVQHSLRVSLLATYVAGQIGASKEMMTEIGAAAMFHDVGKGRIPAEILYKPGRLDDDERRLISTHPQLGTEILLESPTVSACVLGAAWGHHLRFDGKGYPSRRPWFETTQATSLIQVCDVFEALTARRPYKAPYSPARAFQILYADAGAFDPAVLSAFTRAMGLFPPGRFVLMSDGTLGRVARAGASLDRPVVRLFPNGELLDLGDPRHAEVSVTKLLDEPEFVELLMRTDEEGSLNDEDPPAPLPKESSDAEEGAEAARDEELSSTMASETSCEDDGHDDCRLC